MHLLPGATIAPDLYGLGDSLGDWASGVLEMAGPGPMIVVGNSIGGSCALEIARRAPDRVAALVLVGTKAGHRPEPQFRDRFIEAFQRDPAGVLDSWVEQLLGPAAPEGVRRRVHAIADAQRSSDLIRGVRVFHGRPDASDVRERWDEVLVEVRGEDDRAPDLFSPLRSLRSGPVGSTRSDDRMEIVPACGHYVNIEAPAAFNAIVREVVRSVVSG